AVPPGAVFAKGRGNDMRRTGRHDGRGLEYAGSTLLLALAAFVAPAEASAAEDAAPAPGPTEAARSAPIAPASGSVVLHDFRDPPVFSYTEAWDRNYLRALLQYQAITALGVLWYITTTDLDREWRLGYQWETFRGKLTGEAFGLDTNHFGTNFIGHPLGGTGYYHAARANRLTWPASFGFAIAGSLFWEYFGEVTETVSANDMLVDRKSTRLNSSHVKISYAVFCLKKKRTTYIYKVII